MTTTLWVIAAILAGYAVRRLCKKSLKASTQDVTDREANEQEKMFEHTIYDLKLRIEITDAIKDDLNLPGAIEFVDRTKRQYIFNKVPNGVERYDTGITSNSIPFTWHTEDDWLIVSQQLEGKPISQSFHIGMGIDELITTDKAFRFKLVKA